MDEDSFLEDGGKRTTSHKEIRKTPFIHIGRASTPLTRLVVGPGILILLMWLCKSEPPCEFHISVKLFFKAIYSLPSGNNNES